MERLIVVVGDLTRRRVEAIVNAANETLLGGGGVDGAIHAAAGPGLLEECRALPELRPGVRCPTGEARRTGGHRLHASCVIHTVGPIWRGGDTGEPERLASCYRESLRLAVEHQVRTIAFPAISCGVFAYPADRAAWVAVTTIRDYLATERSIERVELVAFGEDMAAHLRVACASAG
jgi:O-acetyl-ADP-ribose deacetylase (regulator of RNase III)